MELSNKGIVWITGLLLLSFNVRAQQVDTIKPKIYEMSVDVSARLLVQHKPTI